MNNLNTTSFMAIFQPMDLPQVPGSLPEGDARTDFTALFEAALVGQSGASSLKPGLPLRKPGEHEATLENAAGESWMLLPTQPMPMPTPTMSFALPILPVVDPAQVNALVSGAPGQPVSVPDLAGATPAQASMRNLALPEQLPGAGAIAAVQHDSIAAVVADAMAHSANISALPEHARPILEALTPILDSESAVLQTNLEDVGNGQQAPIDAGLSMAAMKHVATLPASTMDRKADGPAIAAAASQPSLPNRAPTQTVLPQAPAAIPKTPSLTDIAAAVSADLGQRGTMSAAQISVTRIIDESDDPAIESILAPLAQKIVSDAQKDGFRPLPPSNHVMIAPELRTEPSGVAAPAPKVAELMASLPIGSSEANSSQSMAGAQSSPESLEAQRLANAVQNESAADATLPLKPGADFQALAAKMSDKPPEQQTAIAAVTQSNPIPKESPSPAERALPSNAIDSPAVERSVPSSANLAEPLAFVPETAVDPAIDATVPAVGAEGQIIDKAVDARISTANGLSLQPVAGSHNNSPATHAVKNMADAPAADLAAVNVSLEDAAGAERFSQAVAERMLDAVHGKLQKAEIKLDPPELGKLSIRLDLDGSKVNAQFTVTHASARDAIEMNLPRLRELMNAQGFTLIGAGVGQQHQGQGAPAHSQNPLPHSYAQAFSTSLEPGHGEAMSGLGKPPNDRLLDEYA